jgi:hypothetical protein
MREPSILDYLKSLFDSETTIDIHNYLNIRSGEKVQPTERSENNLTHGKGSGKIILGTGLALLAQAFLEPSKLRVELALILYLLSAAFLWAGLVQQSILKKQKKAPVEKGFQFEKKDLFCILSILFQIASFFLFSGNQFNWLNSSVWVTSIIFLVIAIWNPKVYSKEKPQKKDLVFLTLIILASIIILFFRIFQINEIPSEMFSDHAEKLLDVMDVLRGNFPVFFIRNTGREAIQFYFTAMIIRILGTDINFLSLKIGTVIFGLLTLPFIFLIGKDQSNKWGGFIAFLLAGIGYWPNVISRVGLRYSLSPLFTAPVLYFLIRGLREKDINILLISGLLLGFGLHGYSSFRILPVLVVIIFFLYLISRESSNSRIQAIIGFVIVGLGAFSIFLPLFRYWFDYPGSFSYRTLSRITQIERSFDESVFTLFIRNFWDSIIMPFYKNGQIWVHSVPNRPALDFVSAGLFFVGVIYMIRKIKEERSWEAGSLLISIPILMMPSILSLAYPGENPSLNRSAGVLVPIFVIIGIGYFIFNKAIIDYFPKRISRIIAGTMGLIIVSISMANNFHIVFNEYKEQFDKNAWNSSEIGGVINNFVQSGNDPDLAYVIPYPHWVDTRLVGFNAGYPGKDYALWGEEISNTGKISGDKLYIFKPEDNETLTELGRYFPDGEASIFYSRITGKEFIIYTVKGLD